LDNIYEIACDSRSSRGVDCLPGSLDQMKDGAARLLRDNADGRISTLYQSAGEGGKLPRGKERAEFR
jgi:hypothetical protein